MYLPQEIIDLIVDEVALQHANTRSRNSLLVCSLTSQLLRQSCQRHLFRKLRITWPVGADIYQELPRISQLRDLIATRRAFRVSIRDLEVDVDLAAQVTRREHGLPYILDMLAGEPDANGYAGIQTLKLSGHHMNHVMFDALSQEFLCSLGRLLRGEVFMSKGAAGYPALRKIHFSAFGGFPSACETYLSGTIEELVFERVIFGVNPPMSQSLQTPSWQVASLLKTLRVYGSISQAFPALNFKSFGQLTSLSACVMDTRDCQALRLIFESVAPSLECLELRREARPQYKTSFHPQSVGLAQLRSLRTLSLTIVSRCHESYSLPLPALHPFFALLYPPHASSLPTEIEHLSIYLRTPVNEVTYNPLTMDFDLFSPIYCWDMLDILLSGPIFPKLCKVNMKIRLDIKCQVGQVINEELLEELRVSLTAGIVSRLFPQTTTFKGLVVGVTIKINLLERRIEPCLEVSRRA